MVVFGNGRGDGEKTVVIHVRPRAHGQLDGFCEDWVSQHVFQGFGCVDACEGGGDGGALGDSDVDGGRGGDEIVEADEGVTVGDEGFYPTTGF